MVALVSLDWDGRVWHADVAVQHGVYRRPHYPVTVTYLGPLANPGLVADLGQVVVALVRVHLLKGSLPPGGLLVNLRQVYTYAVHHRFAAGWDAGDLARLSRLLELTPPVARGEGHGYYHPLEPVRTAAPTAGEMGGVA